MYRINRIEKKGGEGKGQSQSKIEMSESGREKYIFTYM